MAAKLTVEFDDETAPGFAELVKQLEKVDNVTAETNTAALKQYQELQLEVQNLRAELAQMETERSQAVQAVAQESRFLAGAMEESGRQMAESTVGPIAGYVEFRIKLFLLKRAAKAAAVQLTGMAAAGAAAVAPAITAAGVAIGTYKTLNFTLENTDRHFGAIRNSGTIQYSEELTRTIRDQAGINATNNEELIAQLNNMRSLEDATGDYGSAMERLQQIAEATGQSFDELGVRAESNATKIGDAFDDLGDKLSEPFERSGQAIQAWWESSSLVEGALDAVEGATTAFADEVSAGLDNIGKGWDELRVQVGRVVGANAEEYRKEINTLRELEEAQERVRKAQERSQPHFDALKNANQSLEEWTEKQEELARIGTLRSDQIDAEIHKLRQLAGEQSANATFKGKNEKKFTELMQALIRRRETALKEETQAAKQAAEEQARAAEKSAKERIQAEKKRAEEHQRILEEAAKAEEEFQEAVARGQEELLLQEKEHLRERQIERLKRSEGNEERITELRKQGLEDRARLELEFATSAAEAAQIEFQLKRDLRDLDHRHALETEQKKILAAEEAAKKQVEAEGKKIDQIKALRNQEGKNLFEDLAGRQSPQKVVEEITKKRLQQSRKEDPGMSRERRRQSDRMIRRQTLQQAQSGQLNPGEVAKAQADLAARQVLQLNKQGKLNKQTLTAMAEQAKVFAEKARFDEEMANQLGAVNEALREIQGGTKDRTQRLRAQRRGMRG